MKKINRNSFSFATSQEHAQKEKEYWANASIKEKFQTITYLRECFYGLEATTGRLQRFYKFFKRK